MEDISPEDAAFSNVAAFLEGRYRTLLRVVWDRLPDGWDHYRTYTVGLSDEKPEQGYASAYREEARECSDDDPLIDGHNEQVWEVKLYAPWLDQVSDDGVMWAIAHELGHVAAGMPCCAVMISGEPYTRVRGTDDQYRPLTTEEREAGEKIADAIARAWGFWEEEEAFERERDRLR